jgi:outer membrane protein assembly factor BamB
MTGFIFYLFLATVPIDSFTHSSWGDKEIPIFLYFKFKNFPLPLKIDWGDGKIESLEVKWIIYEAEHKYAMPGKYVIKVKIGSDYWLTTDTVTVFEELFMGKISLPAMIYGSCALDKKEDIFYIGDIQGNFYAFDLFGQIKFNYFAGGEIYGSPLVVESLIYFGADSFLYCVDKKGRLVFKNKLSGKIYNTPSFLSPDKIVISTDDGRLYFFNLFGKKIKELKFPSELSDISLDEKNNLIFTCASTIYSLNPKGKINFKFSSLEDEEFYPAPIVTKDYIICGCEDGYLYFLDKKKGRLIKRVLTFDEEAIKCEPVIDEEGKIYFGDEGGRLYRYDHQQLCALFEAEDAINASPLIIKKENEKIIFIVDESGYLYALTEKKLLFRLEIASSEKDLYQTPSFLFTKGKLIIPSWDGFLYAFNIGGQLVKSEWYAYRANFFRNGKINK